MAKKSKSQRITFGSIIRLIIFIIIIYFLISWFSQKTSNTDISNNDPTMFIGETTSSSNLFGNIYSKLPENSQYQLENFNQTQVGKFISSSTEFIKSRLNGFPQKQIKEIKKGIIKNISNDMIKNIDQN